MSLQLFEYPFSSYCQKALIALYEHAMPFEFRMLDAEHPDNGAELEKRWPLKRFPGLLDGERLAAEASIIVEYVNQRARNGPTLIPGDADGAIKARMLDRFGEASRRG
jgi:glutathione S-transferase